MCSRIDIGSGPNLGLRNKTSNQNISEYIEQTDSINQKFGLNVGSKNKTSNQNISDYIEPMDSMNKEMIEYPTSAKKKEIIKAATKKIDRTKIANKIMNARGSKIINQQNEKLQSIFSKGANKMIKIDYYDTLLNVERKVDHFSKLFNKIRLRIIHKPFIIIDMLKFMNEEQNSLYYMSSLFKKLKNWRRRAALDAIIEFVEHKKRIVNCWGWFAKMLLYQQNKIFQNKVEREKMKEMVCKRRTQVLRRSLKYFGTMMNNVLRDKKSIYFNDILFRLNQRRNQRMQKLSIEGNHAFVIEKRKSRAGGRSPNRQAGKKEIRKKGPNNKYEEFTYKNFDYIMADMNTGKEFSLSNSVKEVMEENHLKNNKPIKKRNRGDFVEMSFGKRNKGMNMLLGDNTLSPKEGRSMKNASVSGKMDIIKQIREEIMDINGRIVREEQEEENMGIHERIELLNRLTTLMQLLKQYYEEIHSSEKGEDDQNRNNFEQVLQLIKKLMERLLKKMTNNIVDSKIKGSLPDIKEGVSDEEEIKRLETKHRSIVKIGELTRQLTKDLEGLGNFRNFDTYADKQASDDMDPTDDEFQSITAINNLLNEVVQNLNVMQDNIEEVDEDNKNTTLKNSDFNNTNSRNTYFDQPHDDPKNQSTDYIDQIQKPRGIFKTDFMKRRINSKGMAESDFKNTGMKNTYDPSWKPSTLEFGKNVPGELINFFGVLNFKIQKYNKKLKFKSFDNIFQRAVSEELKAKLRVLGRDTKKDNFLLSLAKLSVEVNRRLHLKNHTIYKMNKGMILKRKLVLRIFRMFIRGMQYDPLSMRVSEINTYNGNSIIHLFEAQITSSKY